MGIESTIRSGSHPWCGPTAVLLAAICAVSVGACSKKGSDEDSKPATAVPGPTDEDKDKDKGKADTGAAEACKGAKDKHGQTWFEDDFEQALACARQQDKPLFIDLWAPWCHTCISMQEYIFPDKGLATLADRFVWLAIDTDKEQNAKVQERFPPEVWPTFYVVAPHDLTVQGRYRGAASVAQLREFLVAGEQAVLQAKAGGLPADSPMAFVLEGDRAAVRRDYQSAAKAYRQALAGAPEDWARRPDVLVSLIGVLGKLKDHVGCMELAEANLDKTGDSASVADLIYRANRCAGHIAKTDKDRADKLRDRIEARLIPLIDDPQAALSVDDRSDAMVQLRTVYLARDKKEEAKAIAERQRAILDKAAAMAPNPWAAMTYNWPRAEVYAFLGRPADLIPALEKSTADLPNEYDPPYRLAWVLLKSGKAKEALAPAQKALSKVYGPRKARVQTVVADIYKALGDSANERLAREKVVEIYKNLAPSQASPTGLARAEKALAAMDQAAQAKPDKK